MIVKLDCLYNRLCMIQIWTACICETVLGKKDLAERSSMIFLAYDLGEKEMLFDKF